MGIAFLLGGYQWAVDMNKRIRIFIVAFFYLAFAVYPAKAFAPVAVLAAPQIVTTSGSIAFGLFAGAVGLIGMYLEIQDATSGHNVRVPLGSVERNAPPAPVAAATQPIAQALEYYSIYYPGTGDTVNSACIAIVPNINVNNNCSSGASSGPNYLGVWAPTGCEFSYTCTYSQTVHRAVLHLQNRQSSSCPAGYQASGNECILVDSRASVSDGNVDYKREGDNFTLASAADPDNALMDIHKRIPGAANNVQFVGQENGKPTIISVKAMPGGGTVVSKTVETQPGVVQQFHIAYDADGMQISAQQVQVSAQIAVDPVTKTATLVSPQTALQPDGSATTFAPNTTPASSNTPIPEIKFPTDYARDASVQTQTQKIQAQTDKLTNSEEVPDPTVPSVDDFKPFDGTFDNLTGWQLPNHNSQCPTSQFEALGRVFHFNAHCQLIQNHFGLLQSAMNVVWVVLALFIVLGA